ncbi:tyrosine-type recombinase/integrase [Kitasatospora sp. NPDC049285]|uniref:tyrosine-type recombinase/integrase n=1 Tax=Kitasatospora sp. NPDC049285 TaxID=3157096 RepID=UPI003440A10B
MSPRTVRDRTAAIERLSRLAGGNVTAITRDHVLSFLGRPGHSQWTRCTYYGHIEAWTTFARCPELLDGIPRPRTPRRLPDPLPEADLDRMLAAARGTVEEVWLLLGAFAGLRLGEIAALEGSSIRGEKLRLNGKGGRVDVLKLPPVLLDALRPWAGTPGRLWHIPARSLARRLTALAQRLGVHRYRTHRLRHRYGSEVYRTTRDLLVTQRLMRHSSPATTAGYAALHDEDADAAVDQLRGATGEPLTKETKRSECERTKTDDRRQLSARIRRRNQPPTRQGRLRAVGLDRRRVRHLHPWIHLAADDPLER